MTHCYQLDLPTFQLAESFKVPQLRGNAQHQSWGFSVAEVVHEDTLNYIEKNFDIMFTDCLVSYLAPGADGYNVHIDGYGKNVARWAINWVFSGGRNAMYWYKAVGPSHPYKTDFGKIIEVWNDQDVELAETHDITGNPVLVKIDDPHRIYNFSDVLCRWSISLRDYRNKYTWNDIVKRFSGVSIMENARGS